MAELVPVIFRAERNKGAEVTAVFPTFPGTNDPARFAVYAHVGQHGAGTYGWYRRTRPARLEEWLQQQWRLPASGAGR